MDFWEYLPYPETRGFINGHMVHYASLLEIKCPKCKERDIWDPIPEETQKPEVKIETTTKKQNNSLIL